MLDKLLSFVKRKKSFGKKDFSKGRQLSVEELDEFIYRWNLDHPIDFWWRQKHKVAFNSIEHRAVSFFDMYIEKKEEAIYKNLFFENKDIYIPGQGFLKKIKVDQVFSEEEFEQIELDDFND